MKVTVLTDKTRGRVDRYWAKCVGSCHAATALREDWRRQLKICRDEFGFEYVRFHGLLDDDMSVCLIRDDGSLEYSFFNIDSIFDYLLEIGMKPFIELSFMPAPLASGTKTVFHYRGNITPPKDYNDWGKLIYTLTDHLVSRYGIDEVKTWFFEVWNEPNLRNFFWAGTMEDYFQLYKYAALAIKKVDERLAVGGPSTAVDAWIPQLREFCEKENVPLDFISTHHYPTDTAFGFGRTIEDQMANSKRGILTERAKKSRAEAGPLPLYYTEWNNSPSPRDPYHDIPYNAAFIVKTVTENMNIGLSGYSFWTFTDIFEECGLSSVPFHGGFGLLNIHGIPKPSFRAFQLLSKLDGDLLELDIADASPTVDCTASRGENGITVLISNYNVPRSQIDAADISFTLKGINKISSASLLRIDETHANPKRAWVEMGSPNYLNREQIEALKKASEMVPEQVTWTAGEDGIKFDVRIEPLSAIAVSIAL
ncbi:MAG TPA: beta-xylosidase [Bacillota bacterium]|nr:beta-xylosidase [Bacillota bacterium]